MKTLTAITFWVLVALCIAVGCGMIGKVVFDDHLFRFCLW